MSRQLSKAYEIKRGRKLQGNFEVSQGFFVNQYNKHNGLGYFSKMPMNHKLHTDWKMSPHRLNIDVDYTTQNTVLEAHEFNNAVSWDLPKMESIP